MARMTTRTKCGAYASCHSAGMDANAKNQGSMAALPATAMSFSCTGSGSDAMKSNTAGGIALMAFYVAVVVDCARSQRVRVLFG